MDEIRMSPLDWALRPLRRYADFRGRAPRAEYWWYFLATTIVGSALRLIDIKLDHPILSGRGPLGLTFAAALFVPGLAVVVRRMHDSGRTGWWCLIPVSAYALGFGSSELKQHVPALSQPLLGIAIALFGVWLCLGIVFFVLLLAQGDKGSNRYGPDPYGPSNLEEVFA